MCFSYMKKKLRRGLASHIETKNLKYTRHYLSVILCEQINKSFNVHINFYRSTVSLG